MNRTFLILIGLSFSLSLNAQNANGEMNPSLRSVLVQEETETVNNPSSVSTSVPLTSYTVKDSDKSEIEDLRKRIDVLVGTMVEKDEIIKSLKEEKDNAIKSLKNEILTLQNENKSKEDRISYMEKEMISIASNFLYIPYEDYSIKEVAIPAFNNVKDIALKSKYNNRLELLQDYSEHVTELRVFLEGMNQEMEKKPLMRKKEDELLRALHDLSVYKDYTVKYKGEWQETYLGKLLVKVENKIKDVANKDGQKDVFTQYIKELNNLENTKQ